MPVMSGRADVDPVGIGFIGAGFAASLHAHGLAPLRGHRCELVAVASRTRERAEAFARKFGIPHVYIGRSSSDRTWPW